MTESARERLPHSGAAPANLRVFIARAEALSILVEACASDKIEAVDKLQAAAEQSALVAELGQDAVQALMAKAFRDA